MTTAELLSLSLQGVITGTTVVVGVILAESLARKRERRQRIEALVQELGMLLPRLLVPFMGLRGASDPNSQEHLEIHQSVISCLSEIRFKARGISRAADIRREVARLSGKVTAAWIQWERGDLLSRDDVLDISVESVRTALIGDQENLDPMWRHYDEQGFDADETAPPIS